jgi:hypothetical protein
MMSPMTQSELLVSLMHYSICSILSARAADASGESIDSHLDATMIVDWSWLVRNRIEFNQKRMLSSGSVSTLASITKTNSDWSVMKN